MNNKTWQQWQQERSEWAVLRDLVAFDREIATERASRMVRRLATLRSSQSVKGQWRMKAIVSDLQRFAPDSYYESILDRIDSGHDYIDLCRARWALDQSRTRY
jgi:hypothetical protein